MQRFLILAALAASPVAASQMAATWAMAAGGPLGDFHDPKTGFEVKIPPAYLQPPQVAVGNGVMFKRSDSDDVICSATFAADAGAGAAVSAKVKDVARRWRASAAGKARTFVSASAYGPKRSGPPEAVAIVSDRRGDLVGFPRQRRRSLTILWETPKGVTSLACESPKVRFGILRREFEALAGGVTPPR